MMRPNLTTTPQIISIRAAMNYARQCIEVGVDQNNPKLRQVRQYDSFSRKWLCFEPVSPAEARSMRNDAVVRLAANYKLTLAWSRPLSVREHHNLSAAINAHPHEVPLCNRLIKILKTFQELADKVQK